jgi:hypothetical protein
MSNIMSYELCLVNRHYRLGSSSSRPGMPLRIDSVSATNGVAVKGGAM